MVSNQKKTCNVCFKAMRSDNLKRHMKKHERRNEDNIVNNEELEKKVSAQMEEFNRKIELGRKVKFILDTNGYNRVS